MNITQGLDFRAGNRGSRSQLPLSRGDAGRELTANFNVYYESGDAATDDFIRWDERFINNIVSKLVIYYYYWTDLGKEYYQKVTLPTVELTGVPRVGANTKGRTPRELGGTCDP